MATNISSNNIGNIYIISNSTNMQHQQYKIGMHTGNQRALLNRYKTALIDPVIFLYIPCENVRHEEKTILSKLDTQRVKDSNGAKTEWVNAPLIELTQVIIDTISLKSNPSIDLHRDNRKDSHNNTAEINNRYHQLANSNDNYVIDSLADFKNEQYINDTEYQFIPAVDKVVICSGNDEKHVEKITIDFANMKYIITKIPEGECYGHEFCGRPRELDMMISHHRTEDKTYIYFHKGIIYEGYGESRARYDRDMAGAAAHIKNFTVSNRDIKIVIEKNNDNTIKVTTSRADRGVYISLKFTIEDEYNTVKYLNLFEDDK